MTGELRNSVGYLRLPSCTLIYRGMEVKVEPSKEVIENIKQYARKVQKVGCVRRDTHQGAPE